MCGIFGIWKLAETGYDFIPLIKQLMEESEVRGVDATGVAFLEDRPDGTRKLMFHKLPISPVTYAAETADKIIKNNFKAIIVHNRHATQGDPKVNKNNHPFVSKFPFALIHNGVVYSKYKGDRERPAETDTVELFLQIWDEVEKTPDDLMGAVGRAHEALSGSMTTATLFSDRIVLTKHTNPCWLAYLPDKKAIVFASTDTMLENALGCVLERDYVIFPPYSLVEMKNDSILTIDDEGITLGEDLKFSIRTSSRFENKEWYDYGISCEPKTKRATTITEWSGGTTFKTKEEEKEVGMHEGKPIVWQSGLKTGDLVEDLKGWKLKYLVVHSKAKGKEKDKTVDTIYGIFGETPEEAKLNWLKEKTFKAKDKGGNLLYTTSQRFVIIERGLKKKKLRKKEKQLKKAVEKQKKGKAEIERKPTLRSQEMMLEDWERYIMGEAN